ncbi:hypothetical protein LO772_16315 [Yinghuangia sp. ASG 101]|uniref:hypothetical protein n=1 Tax=Yinghuangia sp. ASG 101 TaxID=2896848 RepID=UPI001E401B2A|nr:hypothetical protein [Yinghuangia sp. ASG 101]UGQ14991.1 hypothetical protein LO772_16315 [Yinghuangia sp. ASG 101]
MTDSTPGFSARLANFEAAVEAGSRVVGALSAQIEAEECSPMPDDEVITRARRRRAEIARERQALDPDDTAAVAAARAQYADEAESIRAATKDRG